MLLLLARSLILYLASSSGRVCPNLALMFQRLLLSAVLSEYLISSTVQIVSVSCHAFHASEYGFVFDCEPTVVVIVLCAGPAKYERGVLPFLFV